MRVPRAILVDSLHEALDGKLLMVLLGLSLLPIVFCFSISFEAEPIETTLGTLAREVNRLPTRGRGPRHLRFFAVDIEVGQVTPVPEAGDWPAEVRGGHIVELSFSQPWELDRLGDAWRDLQRKWTGKRSDGADGTQPPEAGPPDGGSPDATAPTPEPEDEDEMVQDPDAPAAPERIERRARVLRERFEEFGFEHTHVRSLDPQGRRFAIAARTDRPAELKGGHRFQVLFGQFEFPLPRISRAELIVGLQLGLANVFVGALGMLIALMGTSGFVPRMLRKGTLDLLLARPVGRARLLLAKYVGGLWFVLILAAFLCTGCWLGLSLRSGYFNPWFLCSIVTLTATFAVIYSISVLVAVVTRSGVVSALAATGVWWFSSIVVSVHHQIRQMAWGADLPGWLETSIDTLYALLPKTTDLALLNQVALSRSSLSEEAQSRLFRGEWLEVDWVASLSSTAAFTAVCLAVAVWIFRRKDY